MNTYDITPTDPGCNGPKITLTDPGGGGVMIARADDPGIYPWVLVPVTLLAYINQESIVENGDRASADAYDSAILGAFEGATPIDWGHCLIRMPGSAHTAAPRAAIPAGQHQTCQNCGRKISPHMHPAGDREPGSRWVHDVDGLAACPMPDPTSWASAFTEAEPCSWHGQPDVRTCPFCACGDGPHARSRED